MDITLESKFNRWTVKRKAKSKKNRVFWICECDCGKIKEVSGTDLRNNKSKSCGCLMREINSRKISYKNIIDFEKFKSFDFTESVYILGLAWADGSLSVFENGSFKFSVGGKFSDFYYLEKYFNLFGTFGKHKGRIRERMTEESYNFYCSDYQFCSWLANLGYLAGEKNSPEKILALIPENLHYLWYRGYFDGDGCFYNYPKNYLKQFSVASFYEQDWKFMEKLMDKLKINKYKIIKRSYINSKSKKLNSHSVLRISNKEDIQKLGNYIYQDNNHIMFRRKYDKFKEICNA